MRKIFVLLTLFLFLSITNVSAYDSVYQYLKDGRFALDNKEYEESLKNLDQFLGSPNQLSDYGYLWRAKALRALGENEKALKDIGAIKENYRNSPVFKSALLLEIKIDEKEHPDTALVLYAKYLDSYPKDDAMRLSYAKLLKTLNYEWDADREFTKIYINGGSESKEAAAFIDLKKLSSETKVERARNLMRRHKYEEAETELRQAREKAPPSLYGTITTNLATALFRQKKYDEAAVYLDRIGDIYTGARALYRAGKFDEFHEKVRHMNADKSERAAELILISGLYFRRAGNTEKALAIFNTLKENRFNKEEVRWHIGWTYYLIGNYQKAYDAFESLHKSYGSRQYLYWMARSTENMGKPSQALYSKLTGLGDFYSLLALYRLGKGPVAVSSEEYEQTTDFGQDIELKRLSILLELKIDDAIKMESLYIIKNTRKFTGDSALKAALMLNAAQAYYHSLNIAGKLKGSSYLHSLLYPYAYKDIVSDAAGRFTANPLLVLSVMREESRFQDDAFSPAGAIGLMQLMPQTASRYGKLADEAIEDEKDIFNVKKNITIGAYYIGSLYKDASCVPVVLASYNAGEDVVKKWLLDGNYKSIDEFIEDIPYNETRNYVKRVLKTYYQYARRLEPTTESLKFVADCSLH
ncbi:lytic transglycosylase domain-containing protein [Candidatus Magnetomonas plexicatena]|uniref:lytic transglycosylase domain-containing protein n=1 Tax=Candidatus Magnetomonas plexicatena TaxID=2552947 RepID=UPI001100D09A|nr:transglycosylase SLT domain-containing protein [Nitrospirales bacterium LBB_01]